MFDAPNAALPQDVFLLGAALCVEDAGGLAAPVPAMAGTRDPAAMLGPKGRVRRGSEVLGR